MAQGVSALLRTLITALPSSGGTPNISGWPHPRWGYVDALEKHDIAAGFRRDRRAPAMAVSSSCGGLPGACAGVRKKGGKRPQAWRGDDCARRGFRHNRHMTDTDLLPAPVIHASPDGIAFTTSTDVAAFFDKRHSDVLRAIEHLLGDLRSLYAGQGQPEPAAQDDGEEDAAEHQRKIAFMSPTDMFAAAAIEASLGNGAVRRDPGYNLSRDGFALLAMGFTGKQALAFKLAYIAAFNAMDAKLRQPYVAPLADDLAFAKGVRLKDKIMLHEHAYKASRALSNARNDHERRQAYWLLHQINTALGIPMPTMQAMGIMPLALETS